MSDEPRVDPEARPPSAPGDPPSGPERSREGRYALDVDFPSRNVWDFVPKRRLTAALVMLMMLLAIISLRYRAGALVKSFTDVLFAPAGSSVPRDVPSLRLAPVQPSPPASGSKP
jgi:hypothetical protein